MNLEVNKSHRDFFMDKNRWVVSYGGAGSGKSYTTGQKILVRMMTEERHKFLIVRKVATTLRVSVFQLFRDLISNYNLYDKFKINKSDMTITYIPNGSMLIFFGLDNIEKLKSIQGITSIWVEEASEAEQKDVLELNRRLRGETPYYKQIIITLNPISHLHWIKEHFFDNLESTASLYKTTYLDNSFIDDEYKQEIENIRLYDEQQYRIYALGEWGVINGNIIHHRFNQDIHVSNKTVNDFYSLHIGCDFNISACVSVILGEDKDGIAHIVDEFTSYDTENMIVELRNRYPNKELTLYPDASASNRTTNSNKTDVDMLRAAGFYCNVPSQNGATSTRYNACNRKLMSNSLLVNPISARKTFEALQIHAYDEKGMPEKFTKHPAIDDYTDAFGYVVGRMYPIVAGVGRAKMSGA
jgi:phage terminase large subunit